MSEQQTFAKLLEAQKVEKGNVLFVMQGDGVFRAAPAAVFFKKGLAPLVAIVGSADNRSYGSYPSREVRDELVRCGVPQSAIYFEEVAPHTRAEAERAMQLAKEKGWKTILMVTSPHHQYRAYLTMLKAMHDAALELNLVNAVADLSMTDESPWGRRADLLAREFDKITQYQQKGDVASYADGIAYLEKKL